MTVFKSHEVRDPEAPEYDDRAFELLKNGAISTFPHRDHVSI